MNQPESREQSSVDTLQSVIRMKINSINRETRGEKDSDFVRQRDELLSDKRKTSFQNEDRTTLEVKFKSWSKEVITMKSYMLSALVLSLIAVSCGKPLDAHGADIHIGKCFVDFLFVKLCTFV